MLKKMLCLMMMVCMALTAVPAVQAQMIMDGDVPAVSVETAFDVFRHAAGAKTLEPEELPSADVTCDMTVDMQDAFALYANASGEATRLPQGVSYSAKMDFDTEEEVFQPWVTVDTRQYQGITNIGISHNWNVSKIGEIQSFGNTLYVKLLLDEEPTTKTGRIDIEPMIAFLDEDTDVRVLTYSQTTQTTRFPVYAEVASRDWYDESDSDYWLDSSYWENTDEVLLHQTWLIRSAEESGLLLTEGGFDAEFLSEQGYTEEFFENNALILVRADMRYTPQDVRISGIRVCGSELTVETETVWDNDIVGSMPVLYQKSVVLIVSAEDAASVDSVETVRYDVLKSAYVFGED